MIVIKVTINYFFLNLEKDCILRIFFFSKSLFNTVENLLKTAIYKFSISYCCINFLRIYCQRGNETKTFKGKNVMIDMGMT